MAYGRNEFAPDAKNLAKKWVAKYAYLHSPAAFSPLWYNSRQEIKRMISDSINGVFVIAAGGAANGSFPVPSKRIHIWKWEHIWLIYSAFAMAILPIGLALAFAPQIIRHTLIRDPYLTAQVGGCGLLFGVGSVLFGVSLARLGIAITNALVSGIVVFLGSFWPILVGGVQMDRRHLQWLIFGLTLLILSLILCAGASVSRDRSQQNKLNEVRPSTGAFVAVLLAVLAGCLSSVLNVGFASGAPLIANARIDGSPPLLASLAVWIPALFGGLIFNMGYPAYLISLRGSWPVLFEGHHCVGRWCRSALMGSMWFGAILLYGIGASILGSAGSVYGWALGMSVSILTANVWGVAGGEWNGAGSQPKLLMLFSTVLLIASFGVLCLTRLPR